MFEKYCKTCSRDTHCCVFPKGRGFTFVGIEDAKRIQKATKLEFKEFLTYAPLPKRLVKELKDEDPLLEGGVRYKQLDKDNRILRLKHQKNHDCIFLKKGKCSIYASRPNICRIYPYWAVRLLDGCIKVVGHDSPATCPIVKAKEPQKEAPIKRVFQAIEKETKAYKSVKNFVKKYLGMKV